MINTDLTTPLTIYGFGLYGHGVTERTKSFFVPTQKHQKTPKSLDFTSISAFGTKRPEVQILSLRPKNLKSRSGLRFFNFYEDARRKEIVIYWLI